jgi:hypothetical protein
MHRLASDRLYAWIDLFNEKNGEILDGPADAARCNDRGRERL